MRKVRVGHRRKVGGILNQQLLRSRSLSLGPTCNQALVLTRAHHQPRIIEREGLNEASFFGVNVTANNLYPFLGLYRVNEADACPLTRLLHPRSFEQFVQVDAVSNRHAADPVRCLRQERIAGK